MFRAVLASTSRTVYPSTSQAFHTSPVAAKTVTEKVKEVADNVNIKVGRTLASGIEKGEQAAEKTKKAVGGSSAKEAADKLNKSVGGGLASAMEKGEQATAKTQEMFGAASKKSKEQADIAGQKTNQTVAGLQEGMHDLRKDVEHEARK